MPRVTELQVKYFWRWFDNTIKDTRNNQRTKKYLEERLKTIEGVVLWYYQFELLPHAVSVASVSIRCRINYC